MTRPTNHPPIARFFPAQARGVKDSLEIIPARDANDPRTNTWRPILAMNRNYFGSPKRANPWWRSSRSDSGYG